MNHQRLHALSDSIFSIAMTLLVFYIRVPAMQVVNSHNLALSIRSLIPTFLSFILSFAVLYTYWQGHTYVISRLAKNIDGPLSNLNALFLFFVVLVPFSTQLLGSYHNYEISIVFFGLNVIALSVTLLLMRKYIIRAKSIENVEVSSTELKAVFIRSFVPSFCALLAIIVGLFSRNVPILLFTIGVLFNFSRYSQVFINRVLARYNM
jgi:uncharacterized membrane protein